MGMMKKVVRLTGSVLAVTAISGAFYAAIIYHAIDDAIAIKRGKSPRQQRESSI
jgi:hypothetical protein